MKIFFLACLLLLISGAGATAQTVTIYRAGVALSPVYTTVADAAAASLIDDSVVLSAHTFYEHDVPLLAGRTWQGTMTATDSTTIDAQGLGHCVLVPASATVPGRDINIRDVIFTNGYAALATAYPDGAGICAPDRIHLRGHSIVRYCHAERNGGGTTLVSLYDRVQVVHNRADSFGGGCSGSLEKYPAVIKLIQLYDTIMISDNIAAWGGGISGCVSGGGCRYMQITRNEATKGGGAVYGAIQYIRCHIAHNTAPVGAAMYFVPVMTARFNDLVIYNPKPDGSRQNEIFLPPGFASTGHYFEMTRCWFGRSDTLGAIDRGKLDLPGDYLKAQWSVNWGKALTKYDTVFPISAKFVTTALSPTGSGSFKKNLWITGKFYASLGDFEQTEKEIGDDDTLINTYYTFRNAPGDTARKTVDFLAVADADTFRASMFVWGIDSIIAPLPPQKNGENAGLTEHTDVLADNLPELSVPAIAEAPVVLAYPNPARDELTISGAVPGSRVEIADISGKIVWSGSSYNVDQYKLSIGHLPAGFYVLQIRAGNGLKGTVQLQKS